MGGALSRHLVQGVFALVLDPAATLALGLAAFQQRLCHQPAAHQPDLEIHYRRVLVTYSTHSAGGLTEKETLRSWTVLSTVLSIAGLILVFAASRLIPLT